MESLSKKILAFVIIMVVTIPFCNFAFAQTLNFNMSGTIDTALNQQLNTNELVVKIKKTANRFSEAQEYKIRIDAAGKFKANLTFKEQFAYLSFELEDKRKNSVNKGSRLSVSFPKSRPLQELYLFEAGDNVHMQIQKGGILSFSGIGSEKLNCQWQLYNLEPIPEIINRRASALSAQRLLKERLLLLEQSATLSVSLRKAILNSYKKQLSTTVYSLLSLDLNASAYYALVAPLKWNLLSFSSGGEKMQLHDYYQGLLKRMPLASLAVDEQTAASSAYLADALFEIELTELRLSLNKTAYSEGDNFVEVYDRIKLKYIGALRDKLIYLCFENLPKSSSSAKKFVNNAMAELTEPVYREMLLALASKRYKTYPFAFADVNGKIHQLKDYAGKVVVIDLWFTGCINCIRLNTAMHPIIDHYGSSKDVVFITVSTDQKDVWLKSLAGGLYTHPKSINLFTNNLGLADPFIRNYQFSGFPQQLLIDKSGFLVTTSPPRPDGSVAMQQAFMKLVDAYANQIHK
ncbi:MAG: TlpA family protein disulfide reductase [Flavobacteriales bacterium]|nr:MAG: TlpA family protein disulfide reductase [Flavobacteriales bacterium]